MTNCPTCGAIVPFIFEHVDGCPETESGFPSNKPAPNAAGILGLTPEQAGDYKDPMTRLLAAPLLAHARRTGARLTPAQESVANEDNTELREFRASQIERRK